MVFQFNEQLNSTYNLFKISRYVPKENSDKIDSYNRNKIANNS